jgi:hypothetical protein
VRENRDRNSTHLLGDTSLPALCPDFHFPF